MNCLVPAPDPAIIFHMGLLPQRHIVFVMLFVGLFGCQTTPPMKNGLTEPKVRLIGSLVRSAKGELLFTPVEPSFTPALGTPLLVEKNEFPWGIFFLVEDPKTHPYPLRVQPACYVMDGTADSYGPFTVRIPREREDFVHCFGSVLQSTFTQSPQTVVLNIGTPHGVRPGARFQLLQSFKGTQEAENQIFCTTQQSDTQPVGNSVCALETSLPENSTLVSPTYALLQSASPTVSTTSLLAPKAEETNAPNKQPHPIPPVQHPDELPPPPFQLKRWEEVSSKKGAKSAGWALEASEDQAALYFKEGTWFAAIPAPVTTDTRPVAFFYLTKRPSVLHTPQRLTEVCRLQQPNIDVDVQEGMALQPIKKGSASWSPGRCLARVVQEKKNAKGGVTSVLLNIGTKPSEQSPVKGKYLFVLNETQQDNLGKASAPVLSCRAQPRTRQEIKDALLTCKFPHALTPSIGFLQDYAVAMRSPARTKGARR